MVSIIIIMITPTFIIIVIIVIITNSISIIRTPSSYSPPPQTPLASKYRAQRFLDTAKCGNALSDCPKYAKSICYDYKNWACQNCAEYCGFCTDRAQRFLDSDKCGNALSTCPSYTTSVCNDYKTWASQNCAEYCGFCTVWSNWSGFSSCSVSCGTGYRLRVRYWQGTSPYIGYINETRSCHETSCPDPPTPAPQLTRAPTVPAPMNGQWGPWFPYSKCSHSCGTGIQTTHRYCDSPKPSNGGEPCVGHNVTMKTCQLQECIDRAQRFLDSAKCEDAMDACSSYATTVCTDYKTWASQTCAKYCGFCTDDGAWSNWSSFSACSVSCGTGNMYRTRVCQGSSSCIGASKESRRCHHSCPAPTVSAPMDGHWGPWSAYSPCSHSCGTGIQTSHRYCNNPAPSNGGEPCVGRSYNMMICQLQSCAVPTVPAPVDGHWGQWTAYSQCSHSCGTGIQTSHRNCNNPAPSNGGGQCIGHNFTMVTCQIQECVVNGGWGTWTAWSSCSTSCGMGTLSRDRACNNPAPSNGGTQCSGDTTETHECGEGPCPVWSHWFEGDCSVSCGYGTMERLRHCSSGRDSDCPGRAYHMVPCSYVQCV